LAIKNNSKAEIKYSSYLAASTKKYTLVLDLDETLIHYIDIGDGSFLIRPNCREFLKEMSELYEIVIFTAAMQDYADWVIDQLDTGKWITHRLY